MAKRQYELKHFGILFFFIVVLIIIVIVIYIRRKQKVEIIEEQPDVSKFVKPMYKPQNIGYRTGKYKLFMTNKGIRRCEVNQYNWPLPDEKR